MRGRLAALALAELVLLASGLLGVLRPAGLALAALGLLVGWAVYRFYRPAVILSTAAFGGFLLARTVFSLLSAAAAVQYLGRGMGLTAAIAGAVLQFRGRK